MTEIAVLLTIPETAERLRCSKAHVYRLIAAGQLASVDISVDGSTRAKTRIREADLHLYIDRVAAQ
jgi:excisionase family DNA binding protein